MSFWFAAAGSGEHDPSQAPGCGKLSMEPPRKGPVRAGEDAGSECRRHGHGGASGSQQLHR